MRFERHFIEDIRRRISIVDIVGSVVNLKPKGRGEFLGLCPFHGEKTPSFTVSDNKGFYHCFGCGVHGDAIRFLTDHKGLTYPEAIKEAALIAGVELPKQDNFSREKQRQIDDSLELMAEATKWFQQNLKSNHGREALAYLKNRGLSNETIEHFKIGFVGAEWEGLKNHLLKLGANIQLMNANGLVSSNENGTKTYDRFRNRIIFPIFDSTNNPIAFGGRIIEEDSNAPKYLNSPETDLFKKGYILYGYNFARDAAYKKSQIIAVEGYMDVIALHQAGFENVVAPLGTAVTENHIRHLWKVCDEPVFCLDGDNAGLRAMMRLAENHINMLVPGKTMKFVLLPQGKDPDDVIKNSGAKVFEEMLNNSTDLSDALWDINIKGQKLKTPEQKSAFAEKMLKVVGQIKNETVKNFYTQDYKNRIFRLGFGSKLGAKNGSKNTSSDADAKSLTLTNKTKVENILEKILALASFHPYIISNHQLEEFLQNTEISNKNLEKLSFLLIDYFALSEEDGANFVGFMHYLGNTKDHTQIDYLNKTPLRAEYLNKIESVTQAVTAWQYLISEYNLALAENELKKLSHNESSDINTFYLAKNEVIKLEVLKEKRREKFEEVIANESI